MHTAPDLFSYRQYWAKRFGTAPVLPMSREDMDELGWDSCDIIIVTGDAYVDHPSFGMALIGRLLESQGFRVGIIAQPDWKSPDDFRRLGKPNLFFGITAGNMDSMVNRYTAELRIRSNDAYTPDGEGGKRPDRSVVVYAQRAREAFKGVPVIVGGIEASLRRIAHYDYWSDKVRRSMLPDSKADMLIYGNAERAVVEMAHRLANGEKIVEITDVRGTGFMRQDLPEGWTEIDSTTIDEPGPVDAKPDPYAASPECGKTETTDRKIVSFHKRPKGMDRSRTVVRLPSYDQVLDDPVIYAHASRVFHLETNPGNARALVQQHGKRDVWLNPPPLPLTTKELDRLYEFPYTRMPHPSYGDAKNPAWEMICFSIPIMRGCFGGCTFCSITEHEGRIIQSRSEDSVIHEIETIRDTMPGFTGTISDLGGSTANMYNMRCESEKIESSCRRLSCVFPDICSHMQTSHKPLISLYRKARKLKGVKRVLIASGLRYDLAVRDPEYIKELVAHHVGGYLKIAPEHTEDGPLQMMMKPGIGTYDKFKRLFDKYSKEAGKEQYLIPYFIAAHPGTSDKDMLNLALWLKHNDFRPDQVQAFLPTPLAIASAMYHTKRNPLRKINRKGKSVDVPSGTRQRRLHKAFLRYHDPDNWPLLRETLKKMGRADLIGNGKKHLVPAWQPAGTTGGKLTAPAKVRTGSPKKKTTRKKSTARRNTGKKTGRRQR
ncbi:YgiQ family radical SAM protein [Solemya velesiana gill symbiont]|uniref:YgiQ family radical SAM protein n=1 Tax=Solemya velesiana gill symbiont TaxID=1918948 RepID=A0A1T2KUE2_9GAMM|nr:YgiQ family radical SAM protein [Solemya velesiana gill symbiont]OOZ36411.1 YgiQ family radical SAM protein [Solemya velesiana gill symbiont]